eukprot:g11365.t1
MQVHLVNVTSATSGSDPCKFTRKFFDSLASDIATVNKVVGPRLPVRTPASLQIFQLLPPIQQFKYNIDINITINGCIDWLGKLNERRASVTMTVTRESAPATIVAPAVEALKAPARRRHCHVSRCHRSGVLSVESKIGRPAAVFNFDSGYGFSAFS